MTIIKTVSFIFLRVFERDGTVVYDHMPAETRPAQHWRNTQAYRFPLHRLNGARSRSNSGSLQPTVLPGVDSNKRDCPMYDFLNGSGKGKIFNNVELLELTEGQFRLWVARDGNGQEDRVADLKMLRRISASLD